MNLKQQLECLFLGGTPAFIFTKGIKITKPVYYKQVPEAQDLIGRLRPINKVKYFNVPELPLEFVDSIPTDEEDKTRMALIKIKEILDKVLKIIPFKHKNLTEGEDKTIFEEYLKDIFVEAGIPAPTFDKKLMEPDNIVRNGILFSFLKPVSSNKYKIDFRHFAKYDFRKEIDCPILVGNLKLTNNVLEFENIVKYNKLLNVTETVCADEGERFIKLRAELYANAFFELTAVQHLLGCHFLAGFNLNIGTRLLSKDNPLKQFLWNFVYGTMNINSQINTLIGKNIGSVIGLSPFTEESFYEYIRDMAKVPNIEIFEATPAIPAKLAVDLKSIKNIISPHIKNLIEHSNEKYKKENSKMFEFLRSKVSIISDKNDAELLTDLVYAVSAHHEVVGNNSLEPRAQSVYTTYGTTKYNYIAAILVLIITAIPIRKITAHDVECTIKNTHAKQIYINLVKDLLEYESSMICDNHLHLRIKPSNLEAAVQV